MESGRATKLCFRLLNMPGPGKEEGLESEGGTQAHSTGQELKPNRKDTVKVLWHNMGQRSSPGSPSADAGQMSPHFKQMWARYHCHSHRFRSKVTIISADEGQRSSLTLCRFPWAPQSLFLGHVTSEGCSHVSISYLSGTCLLRGSRGPTTKLGSH